MRFPLSSIPAALVLASAAHAQPALEARIGGSLDRLEPAGAAADSRGAFEVRLAPELEFGGRHARVSYSLAAGAFATPGDWSFLANELQGVYRLDLRKGKAKLFLGGAGAWRHNGDAWAPADHRGLAGFANLELKPAARATIRLGYRLDRRWFGDLGELDQTEHGGFLSANLGLQSRTTLIGEVRLGSKGYAGPLAHAPALEAPAAQARGQGMGPGVRRAPLALLRQQAQRARLAAVLGRVAQSLGDRTGAWLQYAARWSRGDVPPALVTTPALFFDDGVYDDPFASDARRLTAGLKHVFASGATAQAFGSWQRKDYRGAPALDADGLGLASGALRRDRITSAGASLELPVFVEKTGRVELSLDLGYRYTRHRSNDAFYDYRSHSIGLGAGVGF